MSGLYDYRSDFNISNVPLRIKTELLANGISDSDPIYTKALIAYRVIYAINNLKLVSETGFCSNKPKPSFSRKMNSVRSSASSSNNLNTILSNMLDNIEMERQSWKTRMTDATDFIYFTKCLLSKHMFIDWKVGPAEHKFYRLMLAIKRLSLFLQDLTDVLVFGGSEPVEDISQLKDLYGEMIDYLNSEFGEDSIAEAAGIMSAVFGCKWQITDSSDEMANLIMMAYFGAGVKYCARIFNVAQLEKSLDNTLRNLHCGLDGCHNLQRMLVLKDIIETASGKPLSENLALPEITSKVYDGSILIWWLLVNGAAKVIEMKSALVLIKAASNLGDSHKAIIPKTLSVSVGKELCDLMIMLLNSLAPVSFLSNTTKKIKGMSADKSTYHTMSMSIKSDLEFVSNLAARYPSYFSYEVKHSVPLRVEILLDILEEYFKEFDIRIQALRDKHGYEDDFMGDGAVRFEKVLYALLPDYLTGDYKDYFDKRICDIFSISNMSPVQFSINLCIGNWTKRQVENSESKSLSYGVDTLRATQMFNKRNNFIEGGNNG